MPTILVPSASHIFSDYLLSSEGISCYNIFQHLDKFGYKFEAISAQVKIKKQLSNVQAHQTGSFATSPTSNPVKKYLNHTEILIRSTKKCQEILENQKIDIIHHMLPAVYNQTFDSIAILKKNRKPPFILGPLSAHSHPRPIDEKMLSKITSMLHGKTIKKCDQLITITDQVKKIYSNFFDETKIWTIPLGVNTQRFTPPKNEPENEEFEVLFAGYLFKLKGVEYLLKAISIVMKDHKEVKLRIVGDGPDKRHLMTLAESLKIKNKVIFEGLVSHQDMPKHYQRCDVFCFPTLGEPFGKTIIEAMACAKPVIASNIGGPSEIIEENKTGLLVPPAQPEILAAKINELLENKKKTKHMGINARKKVTQKYSWEKIAESYHALYREIV